MSNDKPYTDPQLDGHERFRVSKENFGVSNDTRKIILNNLQSLEQFTDYIIDEYDNWFPDYPYAKHQITK
jgi:hypothetical protein